jgi:hypothetical protein
LCRFEVEKVNNFPLDLFSPSILINPGHVFKKEL